MGLVAGGVLVVTAADASGRPQGMTTTAVSAISFEPLRVLVSMGVESRTRLAVQESGVFAVNILASGRERLAGVFASKSDEKFSTHPWRPAPAGSPILDEGVLAWIECSVDRELAIDGHSIFVGRATAGARLPGAAGPLVHYDRRYGYWSHR
jgi:flavin reductase (DIM6/NTAB) family NADH-FMN oxidoreductase RutF